MITPWRFFFSSISTSAAASVRLSILVGAFTGAPINVSLQAGGNTIRALLVTGGCCHDYETQTSILVDGLGQRLPLEWTVVRGDASRDTELELYRRPDWAEGFDVVVHNECFGGVTDDLFVDAIAREHFAGTPGVMIHCSAHSYRNAATDEWRKCVGVTSFRHEGQRPLTVEFTARSHPILDSFPASWDTPNGELYIIEQVWPGVEPLAHAFGVETKRAHVVAWTNIYGKGRIFGTTLGHHNATMSEDIYLDLIARGLLWACERLPTGSRFLRGDCNDDGNVDISDAVRGLRLCFGGVSVPCAAACDVDGDDDPCTGVTDGVRLLMYLFRRGPSPRPPFPECGSAEGEVDCETPPSCE